MFLSLEDETGIANAIIAPDAFEHIHVLARCMRFFAIEGLLQNQNGVVHVKMQCILVLELAPLQVSKDP